MITATRRAGDGGRTMKGAYPTRPSVDCRRAKYTPLATFAGRVRLIGAGPSVFWCQSNCMGAPTGTPFMMLFAYVGTVSGPDW